MKWWGGTGRTPAEGEPITPLLHLISSFPWTNRFSNQSQRTGKALRLDSQCINHIMSGLNPSPCHRKFFFGCSDKITIHSCRDFQAVTQDIKNFPSAVLLLFRSLGGQLHNTQLTVVKTMTKEPFLLKFNFNTSETRKLKKKTQKSREAC